MKLLIICLICLGHHVRSQDRHPPYKVTEAKAREIVERVLKVAPVIDGHNDLMGQYLPGGFGKPTYVRFYCRECPRDLKDYPLNKPTSGQTDIPRSEKAAWVVCY